VVFSEDSRLRRLDAASAGFEFDPVTQAALDKAAELWAAVRNARLATAHPAAVDGDAILAAQTALAAAPAEVVTIATHNARHLSRFPGIDTHGRGLRSPRDRP
jgi:hypothetical protein